jgi:hypothetical protein
MPDRASARPRFLREICCLMVLNSVTSTSSLVREQKRGGPHGASVVPKKRCHTRTYTPTHSVKPRNALLFLRTCANRQRK